MGFPNTRMQRMRTTEPMRNLVAETTLSASNFIMPIFIDESLEKASPIASLPGISRHSLQTAVEEAKKIEAIGISTVLLFGIPTRKDAMGAGVAESAGIVQTTIKAIKAACPNLIVIADCCLCEYTDHGHCGILKNGKLDNDATLEKLGQIALSYAEVGADIVAPSGMMDGMVLAIRSALDKKGHHQTAIMSYSVKYASSFYGPFRDAAGSGDVFKGERKHYQMNARQSREGLREATLDVEEGADFLIVKPAMAYLDIISALRSRFDLPLVAYNVSGEFAMLKLAAKANIVSEFDAFSEVFYGMKRAGADLIISYYAMTFVEQLKKEA